MPRKSRIRALIAIILLVIILALFGYYIHAHPQVIHELRHISLWLMLMLIACYGLLLLWWMGVYNATLALCGKPLPKKENLLLTIYSTLANFFLPLQTGPGVRAAYLKRRHKVPVYSYLMASLIYFAIYAMISAGFLFATSHYWYLDAPAIIGAAIISYLVIFAARKLFARRNAEIKLQLTKEKLLRLFLMTLGQLLTQALIYGIELHEVSGNLNPIRDLSYTGAANFSLFVSLTPGAIGFREAFLALAQKLHRFSTTQILAANVIDRGVYLIVLGALFVAMLATHARDRIAAPRSKG